MATIRHITLLALGIAVVSFTGCVGPMGAGCDGISTGCATCNDCTGCGELYVDPWINHPPSCVDPCDQCGNYNGQSCGKCRSIFGGVVSLWGYKCGCEESCGIISLGGCDSCATGCDVGCGCESCIGAVAGPGCGVALGCGCVGECACGFEPACGCEGVCSCGIEPGCGCEGACTCASGGGVIYENDGAVIHEGAVSPPSGAVQVSPAPYRPHREKKIFNPRPSVAQRPSQGVSVIGRPRR